MSFCEVLDEAVQVWCRAPARLPLAPRQPPTPRQDLLNLQHRNLTVMEDADRGYVVEGATRRQCAAARCRFCCWAYDPSLCVPAWPPLRMPLSCSAPHKVLEPARSQRSGRPARTRPQSSRCAAARMPARCHKTVLAHRRPTAAQLDIRQAVVGSDGDASTLVSHLWIVDTPSTERLVESPGMLRRRVGASRVKSLLALKSVAESLGRSEVGQYVCMPTVPMLTRD